MENDALRDEGRLDGSGVEQVRVVTDFTQLHEDVDHRHEVTTGQRLPGAVDKTERRHLTVNNTSNTITEKKLMTILIS